MHTVFIKFARRRNDRDAIFSHRNYPGLPIWSFSIRMWNYTNKPEKPNEINNFYLHCVIFLVYTNVKKKQKTNIFRTATRIMQKSLTTPRCESRTIYICTIIFALPSQRLPRIFPKERLEISLRAVKWEVRRKCSTASCCSYTSIDRWCPSGRARDLCLC